MKRSIVLSFVITCFITAACNFSAGTKKDLATGFSITYNGFQIGEFGLVNDKNVQTESNQVSFGNTVAIEVDDIANWTQKDGKVFPGMDLIVQDKQGVTVLNGTDILASEAGYAPEKVAVLRGTVTVGDPMQIGESYHAKLRIWDKLKPESEIIVEGDLFVVE